VGRLDMASEGLLFVTNDSAWGARIASPENHIEKTYHVQIDTVADQNCSIGSVKALVPKTEIFWQ
jgi:23S rRNA pseudouridine2605 synthase